MISIISNSYRGSCYSPTHRNAYESQNDHWRRSLISYQFASSSSAYTSFYGQYEGRISSIRRGR